MSQKFERITRDTLIEELVEMYPQLIGPLKEHGIACIRCGEAIWGTLGEVASEKGIHDINTLVQTLNNILSDKIS